MLIGGKSVDSKNNLEREIKSMQTALDSAKLYKDLFAHDVNNILQTIQSAADLLSMKLNKLEADEDINNYLRIINEQINRGARLVSNIRKLSDVEEKEIKVKPIDYKSVLKNAIGNIKRSYQNKSIEIKLDEINDSFRIKANSFLQDVFENILTNAVKYNERDTVKIQIEISKQMKNDISYVKFEFKDNGIGIPDKFKDTIFERSKTFDQSRTGMGIGLSLVKQVLEHYQGEIWVENRIEGKPSKGSNFVLLIPKA
ncbi:MAG: GHKL domain-containing protein [Candidatus Lokiarchaeota archaeon]|nr:GHKL domain-containing protein [Candidatus Lokiarchaeota archaeon]